MKFADPSILYDREYKIVGITFSGGEELVIRNFGRIDGLFLALNHICGVVLNFFVVNGRPSGIGKLGTIGHRVFSLAHDEAHQIMDALLHIVRERKEDQCYLFVNSIEFSVSWLPRNGVKYVDSCCK